MFNLRKSAYCLQKGITTDAIMFSDDTFEFYLPWNASYLNGSELSGEGSAVSKHELQYITQGG